MSGPVPVNTAPGIGVFIIIAIVHTKLYIRPHVSKSITDTVGSFFTAEFYDRRLSQDCWGGWGLEKWRVMHREVFMLTVGRHRRKPWVSIRRENKDEFQNHAVERVIGI